MWEIITLPLLVATEQVASEYLVRNVDQIASGTISNDNIGPALKDFEVSAHL